MTTPSGPPHGALPRAPAERAHKARQPTLSRSAGDRTGPGDAAEIGKGRAPVVAPEVGGRAQRHQPAKVVGIADAAKIMVAAEARGMAQMNQAAEGAQLGTGGVEVIQAGEMTAGSAAEQRVHEPPHQAGAKQPLLDRFQEHDARLPACEWSERVARKCWGR